MPISESQATALDELVSSGKLTGDRAAAAKELVRRAREGQKSDRAEKLAQLQNSATGSFQHAFANALTFGLADKAVDAVNSGARALGVDAATPEERGQVLAQQAADHPYADLAGGVSGTLAGGAAAGGLAGRLGLKTATSFAGRAAQNFGAGAAGGALEQAVDGSDMGGMVAGGVLGGLAGGAGGAVVEKALPAIAPKAVRAWRKLASKLRTSPDDMEAFVKDSYALTGRYPPVAQAIHARDQGLLQGWASRHNTLGTRFNEAAQDTRGLDLSAGELNRATTESMDKAMAPIRERQVRIDPELLASPHVADSMAGPKMKDIRIKIADGDPLTVGDVDRIRQKLRGMQKAEPGGPFGDFADQLRDDTAEQVPEYGAALERYSRQKDFTEGFTTGMAGKSRAEAADTVLTPEAVAGHNAGAITRKGQQAMRSIAPGTPVMDEEPAGLAEMGRGAAHMAAGSKPFGIFHTLRGIMDTLPESYQRELAEGLLTRDPAAIRATLGKMRKAGESMQTIRNVSRGVAGVLGAKVSEAAGR